MPQTDYKFSLASVARYNLIWKALFRSLPKSSILISFFPQTHNFINSLDK